MFVRTESFSQFIRLYPIISFIVGIHIVIFGANFIPFLPEIWIYEHFAGVNLYIQQGEWWRLITPIFVQIEFGHFLFNTISLILFAPPLERYLGKLKFLALYFLSGIIANVMTFLFKPLNYSHVGASGAIFGLFGFYLSMVAFQNPILSRESKQVIVPIVVIGFVMTFFQSGINVTAHVVGLAGGFIFGWLCSNKSGSGSASSRRK